MTAVGVAFGVTVVFAVLGSGESAADGEPRLSYRTPEQMVTQALTRAAAGGEGALADLALIWELSYEAPADQARRGLLELGGRKGEIAEQARWLAAALDPDPRARPAGLVRNLSVLGPFRDHGGGLGRKEGPEAPGQRWGDARASYDWGTNQVRWRAVPEAAVGARGVPLDLMIHPRRESCSYLATRVRLAAAQTFVVQVAAAGAVRLLWNGAEAARSDDLHAGLLFDRLAARVEAGAGDHLLAVKVCSGAIDDRGRVRVRAQDLEGRPLDLVTTAQLPPWQPGQASSKTRALPTALQRALTVAGGASPPPARALSMALLRRLAQADDLRSPRAPGLLDLVASTGSVTPDRLALAGWVAPFGPQRSGWLGQALERALAAKDLETASFCQRALAQARSRAGFADWALATVGGPPLASDGDPQARLIQAMARATLAAETVRRESLIQLQQLAAAEGARASGSLWAHIAWLARDLDPKLHVNATEQLAARLPGRRDREYVDARGKLGQAAVLAAVDSVLSSGAGLASADLLLGLGEVLERAGLRARAGELYRLATPLCPNKAALHTGLARHHYLQNDVAAGERALARARALDPADPRLRAEESLRKTPAKTASETASETAKVAAGLLVEPAVFLARRKEPVRKGEVYSRVLHHMYAESLLPDGRVSRLQHLAQEVVVEPRSQDELANVFRMEGTPEILRARVHHPDGTVEPPLEQRVDRGQARLRWRELKAGDVIEWVLRSWSERPVGQRGDYPYAGIMDSGSTSIQPLLHSQVVLEFPADATLAYDVLHGRPDRSSDQVKDGRRTVRFIWDRPKNIADEPLAPRQAELVPTVVWSLYPTWDAFLRWFGEATQGFTEPDDQVRRLARELTEGKTTRDEKVRALFGYVADRIRYVNYESAERWLPNRPQQVLARRQGDCDDKSTLLISLLKACGLEASLVFVQPRDTHGVPSVLSSPKVAVPMFGHAITFLPGTDGQPGLWLDPTGNHSRVGRLHANEAGVPAVMATPKGAVKTSTPRATPDDNGRDARWTVALARGGAGELQADERHRGDSAYWLREKLGERASRAQMLESEFLASWWPSVGVDAKVEFDPNPADGGDARLRYLARSDAFAHREGEALVFRLSPATTLTSRLAPLTKRTLPVQLPVYGEGAAPSRDSREIEVQAPAGYRLAALPRTGSEPGGEFGEAQLECTRKNERTVLVRRTISFRAERVPPEKYASWRAWLARVDSLMHQSIRFVPARGKAPTVAEK